MSSVNPQAIEQTKQQIRGLISEISQLSKSDLSPEEYYVAFLDRVVAALAAVGGAIWVLNDDGRLQSEPAYQSNISPSLLDLESDEAKKHHRMLESLSKQSEPQLIPPMSFSTDERRGGNPTKQLLVIAPLGHDGQVEGLIEIFQRADSAPATQRGYQRFLVQMCELAGEWFKNRKLRQLGDRHSLWAQADQFSRTVHESLDLRETCYNVVNEGRRLLGVDRVSVGIVKGKGCRIEAISGQDTLDQRSNVVSNLSRIVTRVMASGEPLWYQGTTEDMPPQIEQALESYVDDSFTRSMAILPLRRPRGEDAAPTSAGDGAQKSGEIIGALIIEQIESDIPREVLNPRLELVYEHSGRAITNALDHSSMFLMPVWKTLGKAAWVVQARTLPKTLFISAIVGLILLGLIIIPWEYDMKAKGELHPVLKRDIFAGTDFQVVEVLKDNGDRVTAGEVVARGVNFDLQRNLHDARGRLSAASAQFESVDRALSNPSKPLSEAERTELFGRKPQLLAQMQSAQLEVESLESKQANLEVKSPIDGEIISWDVRKQLENRPVQTGQVLMTVANYSQGRELDLFMRQSRIGHVNDARKGLHDDYNFLWRTWWSIRGFTPKELSADLPVSYIVLSDPSTIRQGKVAFIDAVSQQHEQEGHVVKIRVQTDPNDKQSLEGVRAGTTVKADVFCGYQPVGWVLFHEAWEWLETNVFFW